jgi:tripartite-type tricarboxylate transporter receptor subunit TctC
MQKFCTALICITLALTAMAAWANNYPTRPVRVIVPFAAGGTFDLVGRMVSQRLTEMWGQQVVVDNRPGGATILATDITARSSPDGYTIFLSPNALAANPALHKKLPYDAARDLRPVVLIAAQPMALGTHPASKIGTVRDLIDIAKSQPQALSYGTAGIGSGGHLAGEIFKSMAGIQVTHISYKGGNIAMMDVVSNQIPLVMTGLPNLLPLHRTGRIRILGITSANRSEIAKDIPSISETVPGYDFKNWFGFVVPAQTPNALVHKINADVNAVLTNGDVRSKLISQGFEVIGGSPEDFGRTIKADTAKFAQVIREAGIKPN